MNETSSQPAIRRGATGQGGSGWHTWLFFGGMALAVGIAGTIGVTCWGPEKPVTSGSHLASDPPPAQTLPSLPEDPPPAPAVVEPAPVVEAVPDAGAKKKGLRRTKKPH